MRGEGSRPVTRVRGAATNCNGGFPEWRLDDYVHTVWTHHDGGPLANPRRILQTTDGHLWIVTQDEGLDARSHEEAPRARKPTTQLASRLRDLTNYGRRTTKNIGPALSCPPKPKGPSAKCEPHLAHKPLGVAQCGPVQFARALKATSTAATRTEFVSGHRPPI
jgi:hypothetical protein